MTKRFFALLMAVVMVLALSVPAFAEGETPTGGEQPEYSPVSSPVTLTMPSGTRTYEVYQIFTGDLATYEENGKTVETLSNVKWGVDGTGFISGSETAVSDTILSGLEALVDAASDDAKLDVIEQYVNNLSGSAVFATKVLGGTKLENVPTGYYLVKDNGVVGEGSSYSLNLVQVVGPTEMTAKVSTTESHKTVEDINDSTDVTINGKSADYDIGDNVPFTLSATIAADFDRYVNAPYTLTFHDTEDAGLNCNNDFVVTITYAAKDADPKSRTLASNEYSVTTSNIGDETFQIHFSNLNGWNATDNKVVPGNAIAHAGDVITVSYTSKLSGENVVIGGKGNENKMYVSYSNNPNNSQGGEEGKTPDDKVIVFTYEIVVNKVDKSLEPLAGAEFTLYKWEDKADKSGKDWKLVSVLAAEKTTSADGKTYSYTSDFVGVDDGKYKLEETKTPAGYNTIDPIEFEITATHSETDGVTSFVLDAVGEKNETFTEDNSKGTISTDIVNNNGSVLPETGGIGTTIFYVVGAVLVVGAAVILFAKKKVEE